MIASWLFNRKFIFCRFWWFLQQHCRDYSLSPDLSISSRYLWSVWFRSCASAQCILTSATQWKWVTHHVHHTQQRSHQYTAYFVKWINWYLTLCDFCFIAVMLWISSNFLLANMKPRLEWGMGENSLHFFSIVIMNPFLFLLLKRFQCAVLSTMKTEKSRKVILYVWALWRTVRVSYELHAVLYRSWLVNMHGCNHIRGFWCWHYTFMFCIESKMIQYLNIAYYIYIYIHY